MNKSDFSSRVQSRYISPIDMAQNWYNAANQNYRTAHRIELYSETADTVCFLKENKRFQIDKLFAEALIPEFVEDGTTKLDNLALWIAENSTYGKLEHKGAYESLSLLFDVTVGANPHSNSNDVLTLFKNKCLQKIKNLNSKINRSLPKDVENIIIPQLPVESLALLRATSHKYQNEIKEEDILIKRINAGKINLKEIAGTVTALINVLGSNWCNIRRLDLEGFDISESDTQKISEFFTNLDHLSLKNSKIDSIEHFANLPLTKLSIESSDKVDIASLQNFKKLSSLSLNLNLWLSGKKAITQYLNGFTNLHNLTSLSIKGKNTVIDLSFLVHYKDLEYLDLSNCCGIADYTIIGSCQKLKHLNLDGCWKIKDGTFLKKCLKLEYLNLFKCNGIKDFHFLEECKSLKETVVNEDQTNIQPLIPSLQKNGMKVEIIVRETKEINLNLGFIELKFQGSYYKS